MERESSIETHRDGALARAAAARVITRVVADRRYLDTALEEARAGGKNADSALVQELSYGTLRWYHQLTGIAALFLHRPFKSKDSDVHALLLLGLYQLRHMRVPDHAAVDATVKAAEALNKSWAKGVLNAGLRTYLRQTARAENALVESEDLRWSHPAWLIEALKREYPNKWEQVLAANNQRPPLCLRVNVARTTRERYLTELQSQGIDARAHPFVETAVIVEKPMPVERLPGFAAGEVSVQDAAAQLAAVYLDAQPHHRVLDACAAPGGKAAHILERTPALKQLTALDNDEKRIGRVRETLTRLGLCADVRVADAATPSEWWDGAPFDRVLLDVPCSATGVIRRHPDIKIRRNPGDLVVLRETQARLLNGVWPCVARGGKLLYVTCSVLRDENDRQVQRFLEQHGDAANEPIAQTEAGTGLQLLPGDNDMDGFYYACLRKV